MTVDITIRHIRNLEEFKSLREPWEHLTNQREIKTVFLTWEWLFAWWKVHCEGRELWLVTAWQGNELVGIAPLMLSTEKKYRLHYRLLQSLGAPNIDESDFLTSNDDPAVLGALCDYFLQNKKYWDAIKLHEFRSNRASTNIIKDIFSKNKLINDVQINDHYHIPISGPWDVYLKTLSKNMRQNLERRLRRTKEMGQLTLEHYKGQNVNWEHFEAIFRINKSGAFPEKYESETERLFHHELFETMRSKGLIEIVFVSLDGEQIAFEYGFNVEGRFEDWRTGYNKDFSKQAIGKILLYLLLQDLFKDGYSDFDFLRGEYEHKHDWKPLKNEFLIISAIRPNHIPSRLALIVIPSIWRWVKEHFHIKSKEALFAPIDETGTPN